MDFFGVCACKLLSLDILPRHYPCPILYNIKGEQEKNHKGAQIEKEVPKTGWADFLMRFAEDYMGRMVKIWAEDETDGKKMIGQNPLIAFEGDCDGDIVNGVKIVIGEEGENPSNLFHFIDSPQDIRVRENEENGQIEQIVLASGNGIKTTVEIAS